MEQNWYVAIVIEMRVLIFEDIFITDVKNSARRSYERDLSEADSKRYAQFLKNFQNPMTKFNREVQIAHIRASARVAKYFDKI